jgi:hypothetical protein
LRSNQCTDGPAERMADEHQRSSIKLTDQARDIRGDACARVVAVAGPVDVAMAWQANA